jgi:hypothetical protein
MPIFKNLDGTLRNIFSIGKNKKVSLRNNEGVLEGKHDGGEYFRIGRSRNVDGGRSDTEHFVTEIDGGGADG